MIKSRFYSKVHLKKKQREYSSGILPEFVSKKIIIKIRVSELL